MATLAFGARLLLLTRSCAALVSSIGADCGKTINPRQLDRCMKSGVVMGLNEALKEEVTFDKGKVTSTNWSRYKILTMGERPRSRSSRSRATTRGLAGDQRLQTRFARPAVAAIFDATGVQPRRIPLTPAYVTTLLRG